MEGREDASQLDDGGEMPVGVLVAVAALVVDKRAPEIGIGVEGGVTEAPELLADADAEFEAEAECDADPEAPVVVVVVLTGGSQT